MRTAFIEELIAQARIQPEVFLVVGDLGYGVVEPFAREFPERFLNAGVAEQNMTGIAAGLAREGYNVFTYSIANFPTLRCMEQIRYDVCYHKMNVKIVAVGGGYAYGPLGPSHHATEDLGMLRVIPNLVVAAPADPVETRVVTRQLIAHRGPCYLRLGKAGEPRAHDVEPVFDLGQAIPVVAGSGTAILTTGAMLKSAADFIRDRHLPFSLYSFPYVKPMDRTTLANLASKHTKIITLEEHQRSGGFGAAVLECLHDLREEGTLAALPEVRRVAIPDVFYGTSGSQQFMRDCAGLKIAL